VIPQFVHPLMLWGLAAAAVPVVIHLLNRRRYRVQRWAAMEWLMAAARKNQKRLKMENLLLLILRACAVLFLALALARPTFSDTRLSLDKQSSHLFVLLDNSASTDARTGAGTVFESEISTAAALLDDIGAEDPTTLVVTNDESAGGDDSSARTTGRARVLVRGSHDHSKFRETLGKLKSAPARADLVDALKALEETVPTTGGATAKVAILTDLQRASFEEGEARGSASPDAAIRATLERLKQKGAEVLLIPPGRPAPDNVAVTSLHAQDDRDIVQGATVVFEAEVRNFGERPVTVDVRFLIDGKPRGEVSQTVRLPARPAGTEAPPATTAQFTTTFGEDEIAPHVLEARIAPDALTMDDARTFAFEVRKPIRVLAVDGDPHPDSGAPAETYWLKDAIAIKEGGPIVVQTVDSGAFESETDLSRWDLVIFANVEHPARTDELRARLERYLVGGGAVLYTVGDRVMPDVWNRELWREKAPLLPARLADPRVDLHKGVTFKLDLSENKHPIFADITNPSVVSLFRSPTFWGRMSLVDAAKEKGARVVATYDDLAKSPALVERAVGKGRALLFTSTVDDAWGKLPGDYLFPVLLHEIVYYMTARGNGERNLSAYQTWSRPVPTNNAGKMEVTRPDGSPSDKGQIDAAADSPVAYASCGDTGMLGAYSVVVPLKSADILAAAPPPLLDKFAVNLPAAESDLARMTPEEATSRWPGLLRAATSFGTAADVVRPKGGEFHAPMLLAALLCLVLEVLLVRSIAKSRAAAA